MEYFLQILSNAVTVITGVITIINLLIKHIKLKEVFKNPIGKIFIIAFIISCIIYFVPWNKFHYGDVKTIVIHDTPKNTTPPLKRDTIKPVEEPKALLVNRKPVAAKITVVKPRPENKSDTVKKSNQPNVQFQGPVTNSPMQIGGDHNNQYNQLGLKPREVTEDILKEVKKRVSNYNTPVSVYRRSNDAESYQFAAKIVKALLALGYKNCFINGIMNDPVIGGDPEVEAKRQASITYQFDEGQLNIIVPSNN